MNEDLDRQLRRQADACARMGSPLYAALLSGAAADFSAGGITHRLLAPYRDTGEAHAVPLRLMAALHRLVLEGRAAALAEYFPSAGGCHGPVGAWPVAHTVLVETADAVTDYLRLPCQTNEVGRAAVLAIGLHWVALRFPERAVRLLEYGASAGLNLRVDRLLAHEVVPHPMGAAGLVPRIMHRCGCDPAPLDPASESDCLRLVSQVWPDQCQRLRRLRHAISIARQFPVSIERASAGEWLPTRLCLAEPGQVTVVWHSVVRQYLGTDELGLVDEVMRKAAALATNQTPLVELAMEPDLDGDPASFPLTATAWPGGVSVLLADAGGHGAPVTVAEAALRG